MSNNPDLLLAEHTDHLCPLPGALQDDQEVFNDQPSSVTSPGALAQLSPSHFGTREGRWQDASAVPALSFATDFEGMPSLHDLNAVFSLLEPLPEILTASLEGWQPPQLIVIGAEGSGKSALLERLLLLPIFPTDDGGCTRLPVLVRLRNAEQALAPQLEVCYPPPSA
jgi:hypothetical protein